MMQEADDEQILFDQEGLLPESHGSSSRNRPTKSSAWKRKFIKTIVLCIAFFALGLCIAIPGPTLLDLSQRVHSNVSQILLIFTARSLGYLLGSIIGGFLFDKFDQLLLLFYTLVLTSIATTVAPWCTVLSILAIMIAFQGISMGVLDTGGNVLCIKIWGRKSAPYMQLLHFAFGVGACIAPLLAEPFLINPELLAQANNSSAIIKSHPFQGKAPVLVDLQDIQSTLNIDHNLVKRDLEGNFTFLNDTSINTENLFSFSTTVSTPIPVVPKKPTYTDESHSTSTDADGSEMQKKLKQAEKTEKNKEKEVPLITTTVHTVNPNPPGKNESMEINGTNTASTYSSSTISLSVTSTQSLSTPTSTTSSTTTTEAPTPIITDAPTTTTTTTQSPTTTTTVASTSVFVKTSTTTTKKMPTSKVVTDLTKSTYSDESFITSTNSSVNTTTSKKPGVTSADLLNSALNAISNMSKIQFAYLIIGLLLGVNAIMFLVLYCKETYKDLPTPQEEKEDKLRQGTTAFRVVILSLLFMFFFVYVGMEVTYGGLLSTFSVKQMNWTEQEGATVTSVFWGSIATGRGIAIIVAKVCSPPCMLITDIALVVIGALVLCFGTLRADVFLWIGTLTIGLGMSSLFPTGISWADHYFPLTGKSTGILIVGSSLGEMIVPFITGYICSNESQMALMYSMLALGLVSLILYIIMQKVASSKKSVALLHTPMRNGFEPLKDDDDVLPLDLIDSPTYTNGLTENMRTRQPKIQFKPDNESNGEYKRLIDFSDHEFS